MTEKRKPAASLNNERPSKKPALSGGKKSQNALRVKYVSSPGTLKPVIATGVSFPEGLEYGTYRKILPNGASELLLHSANHHTIDFTAKEGESSSDKYLKHYVAAFDPQTKQLEVVQARRVIVRSCLRQRENAPEIDVDPSQSQTTPAYSSRATLTATFGTKKSKKAVQSIAENRLLAAASEDAEDPLSNAILSSVPTLDPSDELPPSPRANKPLPQPNLTTDNIREVYSWESLVFPRPSSATLEAMPVAHWLNSTAKRKEIRTSSRFISNRVDYLCSARLANLDDTGLLHLVQLHRYIYLLIEIYRFLRTYPTSQFIPSPASWPRSTYTGNIEHNLLSHLIKTFCPSGSGPSKNGLILLQSTILALTLHIPPPSMNSGANTLVAEPTDIQLDLGMSKDETRKLYRELGCKMELPKPGDLLRWGVQPKTTKKAEQKDSVVEEERQAVIIQGPSQLKWAVLKLPLEFPKVSMGAMRQKGGKRR